MKIGIDLGTANVIVYVKGRSARTTGSSRWARKRAR
jgi:actin-like ATPase involved in cell morphogenesis